MMTSHTSTTAAATRRLGQLYVATILAVTGAGMLVAGIWGGGSAPLVRPLRRLPLPLTVLI
jgi:hypothetical protein